ncbi:hypothetical protein ACFYKX_11485 [Cytobacillus sp. FJAT-54145]|uniref:Uncharacterized protein n=1 Tax=Cytobacillus spartinae TaxID=3299023 RepID=A0ABW6KAH9_9BACI
MVASVHTNRVWGRFLFHHPLGIKERLVKRKDFVRIVSEPFGEVRGTVVGIRQSPQDTRHDTLTLTAYQTHPGTKPFPEEMEEYVDKHGAQFVNVPLFWFEDFLVQEDENSAPKEKQKQALLNRRIDDAKSLFLDPHFQGNELLVVYYETDSQEKRHILAAYRSLSYAHTNHPILNVKHLEGEKKGEVWPIEVKKIVWVAKYEDIV